MELAAHGVDRVTIEARLELQVEALDQVGSGLSGRKVERREEASPGVAEHALHALRRRQIEGANLRNAYRMIYSTDEMYDRKRDRNC